MTNQIISQLVADWRMAGIEEGDMLLVHSNLNRTLRRIARLGGNVSPKVVLESFLIALGKSGTLLLPLFNFDFPKGVRFDIRNSPSHMGVFTEVGRLWPGAVRTGHPIYSFSVIGKEAEMFRGLKNFSGYGQNSPFGILHRHGGKIGGLDLPDQNSMTFYHYVEESLDVPYRYHKTFTGQYIDEIGVESTQTFGLFVRNIEQGVITHVDPMGEILWKKKLYTGCRPKEGSGLRVISAPKMFDEVAMILNEGRAKGLLYEIQ
ncbi:MAG: AAC(3) family N-acetyltransferase [Methylobacter sp.]|nr:MAG: AAC(3) family N-acetyltransferase [Methylobacter sp.]